MGNNALVSQVLETSASRAPDMTHALCSLGGGDMGAGIVTLWNAGQRNGMIKGASITTLIFSLGISVGVVLLHRHHENRLDKVERKTADACLEFATSVYEQRYKKCTGSQVTEEYATSVAEENSNI
ncbi:MAG: hypothetical protein J6A97_01470 [Clostridia bacterium]|nr:hypothetical protein [Clostridia bacterium]